MTSRLVVLISGRGSNMAALAQACADGKIDASIVQVIANRPDAAGLNIARKYGITATVCDHTEFSQRSDFDQALADFITEAKADWIVTAGFMRILGAAFVEQFDGKIINIHPSLLPKYPGLNTHARALAAGDTEHGATVHFVTSDLDAGQIIEQVTVPVHDNDDPDTLAARVLAEEHGILVQAVQRCIAGELNT